MYEKGVIQDVIPWKKSRSYFYWRLRRRLAEREAIRRIIEVHQKSTYPQAEAMLRRWFVEDKGAADAYLWEDNRVLVDWLENQLRVSFISFQYNSQLFQYNRRSRSDEHLSSSDDVLR